MQITQNGADERREGQGNRESGEKERVDIEIIFLVSRRPIAHPIILPARKDGQLLIILSQQVIFQKILHGFLRVKMGRILKGIREDPSLVFKGHSRKLRRRWLAPSRALLGGRSSVAQKLVV